MVIRTNFIQKNRAQRTRAKGHIRYIQHRKGLDGEKIYRTLFGSEGCMSRQHAYSLVDEAQGGSTFFRVVISPDMETEDSKRDLSLEEITDKVMTALQEQLHKQVSWVAAVHQDHTKHRHVHALVMVRERLLPAQAMRQTALDVALTQRKELDLLLQHRKPEREGEQWERQQEKGETWE